MTLPMINHMSHCHDKALTNDDCHSHICPFHADIAEIDEAADVDGKRERVAWLLLLLYRHETPTRRSQMGG